MKPPSPKRGLNLSNIVPIHVDENDKPLRFSQSMLDSLESSPESDSTREKFLELEIQKRVQAELKQQQLLAAKNYAEIQAKISATQDQSLQSQENKSPGDRLRDLGREVVKAEINELKTKLEQRKQVQELNEKVSNAKSEVIKCLRENDRRPLDCWASVEQFKEEVAKLENVWIQKVVN